MPQQRKRGGGRRKPPPDADQEPTLGNPDADPVRIHREFVERRMGGGEEPTPERYARARAQFRGLPGALSAPPGELAEEPQEERPQEQGDEGAAAGGDQRAGEPPQDGGDKGAGPDGNDPEAG